MAKKQANDIQISLRIAPTTYRSLERLQKAAGKSSINEIIAEAIAEYVRRGEDRVRDALTELTPRQREVLEWIAEGATSREIAAHLGISVKTVEMHRMQLMAALDIHNVAGLVRYAIRTGLISP